MLADAGVNALGQQLMSGGKESLGAAFAENLLMSLGMSAMGVVGKLGRDAELAGAVERRSAGLWAKVGGGLKEGAVITAHTITGAAVGYVAHRIVTHQAQAMPSTIREWLLQGASIAVGRYVHTSMGERMPGLERLARRPELPEGPRLLAEGRRIDQLARQLETSKQPDDASDLLAQQTKLLDEVTGAIEKLAAEHGDPDGELAKLEAGVGAQRADLRSEDMLDTRLQLAGMTELVPGALWKGSRRQIDDFLAHAKKSDPHLAAIHDSASGRWHLRVDGHELQVQEVQNLEQPRLEHGEHRVAEASSGGAVTQSTAAHHDAPDTRHRLSASISGLDGRTIAAQVPDATYERGGTFRIVTEQGQLEVSIRRTTGATRMVRDGDHATIEISRGLTGADLESATVEQLRMARAALARGAASGGREHADNASMPTSVDEASARKASGEHWSNKQVRDYYNAKNGEIPALDEQWKQQGLTAEQRARKAYEIRHRMRMTTREMMGDGGETLGLLVRDALKYGDGEGPTFEQLVEQQARQGKTGDEAYEAIIAGAERTDRATNERVRSGGASAKALAIPPGVVVQGDSLKIPVKGGEPLTVRIRTGAETHPTRMADGTLVIYVEKDAPPDIALRSAARQLQEIVDTPRQSSTNLDQLYAAAEVAQAHLSQITRTVATELGGRPLIPTNLKGRPRAEEKIAADYEGENARIVDLARSSIEFDKPQQIEEAIKRLGALAEVVRIKDRFKSPVNGYRDVTMNLSDA